VTMDWNKTVALKVGLGTPPGPDGDLPPVDFMDIFDLMDEMPLHGHWLESLPDSFKSEVRTNLMMASDRHNRGRQWRYKPHDRCMRRYLENGDWSSLSISDMFGPSPGTLDVDWGYSIALLTNVDTGERMAMWGSLIAEMDSPGLADGLPPRWRDEVWRFMHRGAVLFGALYGFADIGAGIDRSSMGRDNYNERHRVKPLYDPDWIPRPHWIFLVPPRALAKLGGWAAFTAEAPVFHAEPIEYADGRVGALAQTTDLPQSSDRQARDALREYLRPILR
jgi:hypothetical protein